MIKSFALPLTLVVSLSLAAATLRGQDESDDSAGVRFFESKIRPVLVQQCYGCHSAKSGKTSGGLQLDTKSGLRGGGDSGPAIVPNDLEASVLWSAINYEDYAMPPSEMLSGNVIADFREWILMGAPDPREPTTRVITSQVTAEDIQQGRLFWSFTPPKAQAVPSVLDQQWPRNSIDHFVLSKLESHGMQPAADADPHTVLRRLCFDLTGLPPTPEQIEYFVARWEESPDRAVKEVVDALLDSERFGERWGRHWLDVARYAESSGKELNATFPHAWRYRDYVIDSFNNDKPYDRFIQEQIAGDLLPVNTDEQWTENLIATGFLALGPKTLTEQNPRQFDLDLVDEQLDVTTRVVLGLSVACARCHDHKFDPIPQVDYYAMAGIFQSTLTYYGTIDTQQNRRPSGLIELPVDDPNPFDRSISPGQLEDLKSDLASLRAELTELRRQGRRSNGQPGSNAQTNRQAIVRLTNQIAAVEAQIESYDMAGQPRSFCMGAQPVDRPVDARVLIRGEVDQPAQVVPRGFVQVLDDAKRTIAAHSSGRLELAQQMTGRDNPLTARVMANRIWLHLLGEGIVRTPENFGATGQLPTHPELLDHLAISFVRSGWSVKSLIREVTTSRTYRMSSAYDEVAFQQDPDNHWLWRANTRRIEAEVLRDAMLLASGELNVVRPRASLVARAGQSVAREGTILGGTRGVPQMSDRGTARSFRGPRRGVEIDQSTNYRSVYLPVVRNDLPRALDVFDFAEPSLVVGQREQSNTPDQSLYFMNNDFVAEQCDAMANRLLESAVTTTEQIELAFVLAFGRPATASELQIARDFYDSFASSVGGRTGRDRKQLSALCQALLASAEFRFIN